MKAIHLSYWQRRAFRVLCIAMSLLIEIVNLILTPVTWLKAKAHFALFLVSAAAGGYMYLSGNDQALWKALLYFIAVVLSITLIKILRRKLEKLRLWMIPYKSVLAPMYIVFKIPRNPIKQFIYEWRIRH